MAESETLRQRHLTRLFEVLPELLARLTQAPERQRADRDAALHSIVAHALMGVPAAPAEGST
jgi:hypothetical protein